MRKIPVGTIVKCVNQECGEVYGKTGVVIEGKNGAWTGIVSVDFGAVTGGFGLNSSLEEVVSSEPFRLRIKFPAGWLRIRDYEPENKVKLLWTQDATKAYEFSCWQSAAATLGFVHLFLLQGYDAEVVKG